MDREIYILDTQRARKRPRIAGSDANYPSTVLDLLLNILGNITKNRFQSDKFQIDFKFS